MRKNIFLLAMAFCYLNSSAQNGYITLKKRQKTIRHYTKDAHITFQLHDGQWLTGIITKIVPDSFYLKQEIIRYSMMGSDTLHFSGLAFSLADIYALPTKKEQIVYVNDRVKIIPGHEKFLWIRNGFIFQVAGAGYVGLNVINDIVRNGPPFARNKLPELGVGAAIFLLGQILHLRFDPYLHIGKKYKLESVIIKNGINKPSYGINKPS